MKKETRNRIKLFINSFEEKLKRVKEDFEELKNDAERLDYEFSSSIWENEMDDLLSFTQELPELSDEADGILDDILNDEEEEENEEEEEDY